MQDHESADTAIDKAERLLTQAQHALEDALDDTEYWRTREELKTWIQQIRNVVFSINTYDPNSTGE